MSETRNKVANGFVLLLCFMLLFVVTGCGKEDSPKIATPKLKNPQAAKQIVEDPLAAEKAEISEMDAQKVFDYINYLSEADCSLEIKDDGAMWVVSENGNGANVRATDIVDRTFKKDDKEYHKYGFGIEGHEGVFFFYTEEENHPLMLYAIRHLKKLATSEKP